jgi:hypothetical protein
MRTHFVLLIALIALIGATPAIAAPPVLGPADGVQATRTDTTLVVTFTGDPAKWTPLVGREVIARCRPIPDARGLQFVDDADDDAGAVREQPVQADVDGALRFALIPNKPFDVCDLVGFGNGGERTLAQAAVSPSGLNWLDESRCAKALRTLMRRAAGPDGYRPLAALGVGPVALDGPAGAPGPGEMGYWTDGARHAVVSTFSAAGRLLVIEDLGDAMLRTNVFEQGEVLDYLFVAPFLEAMGGDQSRTLDDKDDGRGSPFRGKTVTTRDGVRGTFSGKRLVVRFTGRSAAAVHKVAGRRVRVSCVVRPPRVLFDEVGASSAVHSAIARAPRRGATLRAALPGAGDLCLVFDEGKMVAFVLATANGRRWWADIQAVKLIARLAGGITAPGGQAYLAPDVVAARQKGVTAVAGPDATAPFGRVGVWTDGARRAVVAIRSASGRRLVSADEGDGMVRSNLAGETLGLLLLWYADGANGFAAASS